MKKLLDLYENVDEARPFDIKKQPDKGLGVVQAVGTKDPTRLEIPAQILSWAGLKSGARFKVDASNGKIVLTVIPNPSDDEVLATFGQGPQGGTGR